MELKTASDSDVGTPRSEDSRSMDGNAADDENSEPEYHPSAGEHRKFAARSTSTSGDQARSVPAHRVVLSFANAQRQQQRLEQSTPVKEERHETDGTSDLAQLYSPKVRLLFSKAKCQQYMHHRQFRRRWRPSQILQFCGDDRRIRHVYVHIWPLPSPCMLIVPAKLRDLRPSPSFTKPSISTCTTRAQALMHTLILAMS